MVRSPLLALSLVLPGSIGFGGGPSSDPSAGGIGTADEAIKAAPPVQWNVDASHSEVVFSVRHFFTPVSGSFHSFEVTLDFDAENPANSKVRAVIDVASIDTRNERRDAHLRSPDFFDAEKYPRMTFESTSVRVVGPGQLMVRGNLTIKSTTREIELPVTIQGIKDLPPDLQQMFGGIKQVASFTAQTRIDRRDFGVGVGSWAETIVVGGDVNISISIEANRR